MSSRILATVALIAAFSSSHGALLGRAPLMPGGTDYQAYYDTDLHITWLRDANRARTSGYSRSLYLPDYDGGMYWADAHAWADQLIFADRDDWRLPTQSEMGHLHYGELGHVLYNAVPNWIAVNEATAPFVNVGWQHYWSGEPGFIFNFREGTYNSNAGLTNPNLAWAVRDGDISPVPIPAAAWLLGSGLAALGRFKGMARS